MRKTKRVIAQFTFYDRTGIQQFLEKQALKGWMLEKISSYGWKFRRIEPQKINFAVTYFPEASMFDPEPGENQKSFWDLCEHTGWQLASHNAQMQIFYNKRENPVPIETDPETELETIEKSAKKSYLISYYILAACAVLQVALGVWQFSNDPVEYLSMGSSMFSALCWTILITMCSLEIGGYFVWRRKARKAIDETGEFTATRGFRNIQLTMMWIILAIFAVFIFTIERRFAVIVVIATFAVGLLASAVWGFSALLKRFKVSAKANRIATIIAIIVMSFGFTGFVAICVLDAVISSDWFEREAAYTYEYKGVEWKVYDDELPLMVEDMVETDYDGYSTSWYGNESVFLAKHDAYQRPRMDDLKEPYLQYTLVKVKMPFLYDFIHKQMLKDFPRNYGVTYEEYEFYERAVEIDASEWGANHAYQIYMGDSAENEYLLCYNDCIIELRPDYEMIITPQAKANVGRIFG
ncbi:MAG: DUF2812 domain-containing protein [Oscillospiraceae bacterium]|nr:DUF2812 domain-containing protein [Oscillospiraceae bacterium]